MTDELLSDFPVTIRLPVQWGEMDAYGHVNNAVYFRYFESARIRYLEECGFTRSYEEDRVGAILHSTDARFRRALEYPDTVEVGARATDLAEDRFTMEYVVVSERHEARAARGTGIIVSFDYGAGRKAPIPGPVRRRILEMDGEALRQGGGGG